MGQLGDGSNTNRNSFVQVVASGVRSAEAEAERGIVNTLPARNGGGDGATRWLLDPRCLNAIRCFSVGTMNISGSNDFVRARKPD